MAELLKGRPVAEDITRRARAISERLAQNGVTPTLALVRIGSRDADLSYERGALKRCASAGIQCRQIGLPEDVGESGLLSVIRGLNGDDSIHGVLLFRPFPKGIRDDFIRGALTPAKDVDGITDGSLAGVFTGSGSGFCPCTAQAVIELLDFYGVDCTGRRAVVLGRSLVIGRPVAQLLLTRNATVTVLHTRTRDLPGETRRAEIAVVAAGHAGAFGAQHAAPGQVVVDVGINTGSDGQLCGDVDFPSVEPVVGAITPVPGGVGVITSSVLALHTAEAAAKASGAAI